MGSIVIILVIVGYVIKSKFIRPDDSTNRFFDMLLLIVAIWGIQDLIEPDSCKCESNSLFIASIISLGLLVVLSKISKFVN